MRQRFGWAFAGAMALVAVLALARATTAGPLDPPGPVGSTMRTLDELVPSWGKTLSSTGGCTSQRFQCVMTGNAAVLDKETGLVWLRNPIELSLSYNDATVTCGQVAYAGRGGWRLPSAAELWTLPDDSADSLPDGHPFLNVSGGPYWTTTINRDDDQLVQTIGLFGGFNEELAKSRYGSDSFSLAGAWCVRGGMVAGDDSAPAEQPSWSRTLSAEGGCSSARFECVMNGVAVLDRETGLVWDRSPGLYSAPSTWEAGTRFCGDEETGGRFGWRPPSLAEALSLFDPAVGGGNSLPVGHPFDIAPSVENVFFVTTSGEGSTFGIFFSLSGSVIASSKTAVGTHGLWCVRGPGDGDSD